MANNPLGMVGVWVKLSYLLGALVRVTFSCMSILSNSGAGGQTC